MAVVSSSIKNYNYRTKEELNLIKWRKIYNQMQQSQLSNKFIDVSKKKIRLDKLSQDIKNFMQNQKQKRRNNALKIIKIDGQNQIYQHKIGHKFENLKFAKMKGNQYSEMNRKTLYNLVRKINNENALRRTFSSIDKYNKNNKLNKNNENNALKNVTLHNDGTNTSSRLMPAIPSISSSPRKIKTQKSMASNISSNRTSGNNSPRNRIIEYGSYYSIRNKLFMKDNSKEFDEEYHNLLLQCISFERNHLDVTGYLEEKLKHNTHLMEKLLTETFSDISFKKNKKSHRQAAGNSNNDKNNVATNDNDNDNDDDDDIDFDKDDGYDNFNKKNKKKCPRIDYFTIKDTSMPFTSQCEFNLRDQYNKTKDNNFQDSSSNNICEINNSKHSDEDEVFLSFTQITTLRKPTINQNYDDNNLQGAEKFLRSFLYSNSENDDSTVENSENNESSINVSKSSSKICNKINYYDIDELFISNDSIVSKSDLRILQEAVAAATISNLTNYTGGNYQMASFDNEFQKIISLINANSYDIYDIVIDIMDKCKNYNFNDRDYSKLFFELYMIFTLNLIRRFNNVEMNCIAAFKEEAVKHANTLTTSLSNLLGGKNLKN